MGSSTRKEPRCILRVELSSEAKEHLDIVTERTGMTRIALLSRLVTWLGEQPELIQAAVLGRYPKEIERDVARLVLQRAAGNTQRKE